MNRRTFLKSVGAAVAVIAIPVISATSKPEPKWIKFSEATPKVGQKVIIASEVSTLGMICGGVVDMICNSNDDKFASVFTIDDFYVGYNGCDPIGLFYSEKGKDILSTRDWIREREFIVPRDFSECHLTPHLGEYHKKSYFWLAVDGDYPKTIPPIPTNPIFAELENKSSDNVIIGDFGIRRRTSTNKG